MSFHVNDPVTIAHSTMSGVVNDAEVDKTTLVIQYLVEYTDKYGEVQQRYFVADDLVAA